MADFMRARSAEQKEARMEEIKRAADRQFLERPYHEITLTTIAEQLSWSRANLYKYVTTKEEIFLELAADKYREYFDALKAAFPAGCSYDTEVFARVWAEILSAHPEHLRYSAILSSIIETNVSVERLSEFKNSFHCQVDEIDAIFSEILHISSDEAYDLFMTVHYQAVGKYGYCHAPAIVMEALEFAGIRLDIPDFKQSMLRFIYMNLKFLKDKNN